MHYHLPPNIIDLIEREENEDVYGFDKGALAPAPNMININEKEEREVEVEVEVEVEGVTAVIITIIIFIFGYLLDMFVARIGAVSQTVIGLIQA